MSELKPGDAITVTHPTTWAIFVKDHIDTHCGFSNRLQEETRIVRMVLSDFSMGISSALSTDLISTTLFRYIQAPKQVSEDFGT